MSMIAEFIIACIMVLISFIASIELQTPFILWGVLFVNCVILMWRWA